MATTTATTATTSINERPSANMSTADGGAGQWYFAYGANMDESVFVKRRQIQPRRTETARIDTHALCFNVAGVPYDDPGQGGREEADGTGKRTGL